MEKFTAIKSGKLYRSKSYWLKECPECKTSLYSNKYKSLLVSKVGVNYNRSISISMAMEFCPECKELYVRHDY